MSGELVRLTISAEAAAWLGATVGNLHYNGSGAQVRQALAYADEVAAAIAAATSEGKEHEEPPTSN